MAWKSLCARGRAARAAASVWRPRPRPAARPASGAAEAAGDQAGELVTVRVNGHPVVVHAEASVLDACNRAHVYVPTLCHHPRLPPVGTCRLCLVAVDGDGAPRPACSTTVREGMSINTETEELRETVEGNLRLLMSDHPNRCATCTASGHCELQDLTQRYGVGGDDDPGAAALPKRRAFDHEWDDHTHAIVRESDKCVKCGRCVRACSELQGMNVLGLGERGGKERLVTFGDVPMEMTPCIGCGQCAWFCPVGAIVERPEVREVMDKLEGRGDAAGMIHVAATAPSVRVTIGEDFGYAPGAVSTGQMVEGLRRLGFDYVFDTNLAADLCIMEEGSELISRVTKQAGPLPMFTSCCPGWVSLVEGSYPQLIPNLSTARSPQGMLGAMVKSYFAKRAGVPPERINLVSVMPCTAKKAEADRPQLRTEAGVQETDHVLTTREITRMMHMARVQLGSLPESEYDDPLGESTGAAAIFGSTGGVMEAAVRTAHELVTGEPLPALELTAVRGLAGVKEATVEMRLPGGGPPLELRVAVVHSTSHARRLVERVLAGEADYHFVEVMACQGGCIGGGGQPKSLDADILRRRMEATYSIDERMTRRKSHENPSVKRLYEEFLGEPLGHRSHELLHTTYAPRRTCFDRFHTDADLEAREQRGGGPTK